LSATQIVPFFTKIGILQDNVRKNLQKLKMRIGSNWWFEENFSCKRYVLSPLNSLSANSPNFLEAYSALTLNPSVVYGSLHSVISFPAFQVSSSEATLMPD